MLWWLVGYVGAATLCGLFGSYVATQKGRSPAEGFLFGFALGPLGIVVAVLLPTVEGRPAREAEEPDEPRPRGSTALRIQAEQPKEEGLDLDINW